MTRPSVPGGSFGSWVLGLWRERFAQIATLVSAANVLLSAANARQPELSQLAPAAPWFDTISHILQAVVILVLLAVLYQDRYARPKDSRSEPHRFCLLVQAQFYAYWRYLWFAWFVLYTVLAGYGFAFRKKTDDALPLKGMRVTEAEVRAAIMVLEEEPAEKKITIHYGRPPVEHIIVDRPVLSELRTILLYQDLISNILNNFQTLFFFCCYFILLCERDDSTNGPRPPPLPYFAIVLFLLSFFEFIANIGGVHQHDLAIFRWLSAFAGGAGMALLVGRLAARPFGAPLAVISFLYCYAVGQSAWAIGGTDGLTPAFKSVMFSLFLVLKVLLFLYVLWLCRSGRMLYYVYSVVHIDKHDDASRRNYLDEHVDTL